MKISIKKTDNDFCMEAVNESGNKITMDASVEAGGKESAFRPMQLLLSAIGGCSAIDIILILKKQKQIVDTFEIEVEGHREKIEEYSLFKTISLHFKIKGQVDREKAERAVQLSIEKYCSVAKTLEQTAKITYKVSVN